MKTFIATAGLILAFAFGSFAQSISNNFGYGIRPTYKRPIKKEILEKAQLLEDIIPDYPHSWLNEYISVDIMATGHGKTLQASGSNSILNAAQKNVLSAAAMADDVEINVSYKSHNLVSGEPTTNDMHVVFTVVPETEAEFAGGTETLNDYFKKKGFDKISAKIPSVFRVAIKFTVNEQGKVVDAYVSQTSGSVKIDRLLLEAINRMPTWKPAQDAKGTKVKQEFEFTAGKMMGGC